MSSLFFIFLFNSGFNVGYSLSIFSFFMDWFHNYCCVILFGVLLFIVFYFYFLFNSTYINFFYYEYWSFDFFCGLLPIFFLLFQGFSSIGLLYYLSFLSYDFDLDIKVFGHQWYWTYEYSDFSDVKFDSYMKNLEDFVFGDYRLLDVDNRALLPVGYNINFNLTSSDVIHSWTLFNFFLKMDAMSGVVNSFGYVFPFVGVFYGQCSEICGVNHSYMPIVVESVLFWFFKSWLFTF